jgi:hypothetical protein
MSSFDIGLTTRFAAACYSIVLIFLAVPAVVSAQVLQPGAWNIKGTVVELVSPGTLGLLLKMARGQSKTERMCLAAADTKTGVAVLLRPKPEMKCTIVKSVVAAGRIDDIMSCQTKKSGTVSIARTGTYNASGFTLRLTMTGRNDKGATRFVADQVAKFGGASCPK